jgi:hypothetical protein
MSLYLWIVGRVGWEIPNTNPSILAVLRDSLELIEII